MMITTIDDSLIFLFLLLLLLLLAPLMIDPSIHPSIHRYHDIWSFLNLSSTSTLREFKKRGEMICNMDFVQLTKYNIALGGGEGASEKRVGDLPEMCFLASYTYTMLFHGYGFGIDRKLTSTGKVEYEGVKLKIGWPLGAMLYEINTLPWIYDDQKQSAASSLNKSTSSSSMMTTPAASHENRHMSSNLMDYVKVASSSSSSSSEKMVKKKIDDDDDIDDDNNDVSQLPPTLLQHHDDLKLDNGSEVNILKKDDTVVSGGFLERITILQISLAFLMMAPGILIIITLFSKAITISAASEDKSIFNLFPIVLSASSRQIQDLERRKKAEISKLDVGYGSIVADGPV